MDKPIRILDFWDIYDVVGILSTLMLVGVILYEWWLMLFLLLFQLVLIPRIKRNHNRGVFLHFFYKNFNIDLPGMMNPGGDRKFSD